MKISLATAIKTIFFVYILSNSTVSRSLDINMDFEGGTSGSIVQSPTCDMGGGVSAFSYAAGKTFFTADDAYGPGQSAELNISQGATGFGTWGGGINFADCGGSKLGKGDEAWVRVRTKFPLGFNYDGSPRLKFMRFRTNSSDGNNEGYDDWYINPFGYLQGSYDENGRYVKTPDVPYGYIKEGAGPAPEQGWATFGSKDSLIELGKWITYEYYVKFDSKSLDDGGEAVVRACVGYSI